MTDVTNAPVPPPDDMGVTALRSTGMAGFMASTTGKLIVGALALIVLAAIAGFVVFMFASGDSAGFLGSGSPATVSKAAPLPAAKSAPVSVAPVLEPAEKPLASSFTFRNVFAPSVAPPVPPSAETSGSSTASPDTLYLTDILSTGDVRQGVFVWNGATYTVGKGGVIPSSPWKVLEVGPDSVLMLYGDTQVTLTLGQGYSK